MVKAVAQNVAQQIKQLGEDVFETTKKQPQELAGKVLEQMGEGSSFPSGGQKTPQVSDETKRLAEMRAVDEAKSRQLAAKIIQELEQEIEKWRQIREEQLRQRRQTPEPIVAATEVQPLQEPTPKRRRGILGGFWGRRAQRAREQVQPEMAGRRVSG